METSEVEKFNLKNFLSTKGAAIAAATVAVVGVGALATANSVASGDKIVLGIRAEGQPIGGMNRATAEKVFTNVAAQKIHPLTFRYEGEEFVITPEDINLTPLVEKATQEAFSYGRSGSTIGNFNEQIRCIFNGRNVKLDAQYDSNLLDEKLNAIAAQINRDPVNAICRFSGDVIEKIPGVVGKKLNTQELAENLKAPLTTLNLPTGIIDLKPEEIQPFITTEDISQIDSVLGSFSTYYYPGDRGDNIWLAANSISDKIVKPSWTFSFNDTVGERTWDAGYKVAGVIINGRPAEDYGGGVCQVSSTLYNAVLLAGLTPTERTPHFYQSTYVAPGRDATVADGYLDFKFRNDFPHNVYLIAEAYGSTLSVYVLGTKADLGGAEIAIEREGSDMSPSIYRVWYSGNEVIKSEFLHTDVYETPKPRLEQGQTQL
ncbi:MAG: VanW family protein [Selenomonadaceae bacterium]|nr:VanW family protein [Selenomonadaceae bacterium]MBQ7493495.1 VanW family protein [Selenomonadaceae bacterium]